LKLASTDSAKSSAKSSPDSNKSEKKKTILDFISGPWQSSAASKAIVDDNLEQQPETEQNEETNTIPKSTESDGISSLSGGPSPDRPKSQAEIKAEAGVVEALAGPTAAGVAMMLNAGIADSDDEENQDSKPAASSLPSSGKPPSGKKKWKGTIFGRRRKDKSKSKDGSNSNEEVAASALALQEDSSVSSWSRGSSAPEDALRNPYAGAKPGVQDNMPEEMKAFGEDIGLAVVEHDMKDLGQESDGNDGDGEASMLSKKSSNSLRDELDKAIESGDWAAVEAQTNKLFDVNSSMDQSTDTEGSPVRLARGGSFNSQADSSAMGGERSGSEGDNESRGGWSTNSRSVMTDDSEPIDEERIAMLEKLIETDDWQGIVAASRITGGNYEDSSSMASSLPGGLSLATGTADGDNAQSDYDDDGFDYMSAKSGISAKSSVHDDDADADVSLATEITNQKEE